MSAARRRPRQNINRRAAAEKRRRLAGRLAAGLQAAGAVAGVVLVSCFFIFVHDMFIQSDYFNAKQIAVEGTVRLSAGAVAAQAGVRQGTNILSVNLSAARKKLLAHPWIAEAEIRRELPSDLRIRIREHTPAAVVEFSGRKFLLSADGVVFKAWEASDPQDLPLVTGLAVSDLRVADRSGEPAPAPFADLGSAAPPQPPFSRPMDAVIQVLALGSESEVLPARRVRAIRVDRELGLSIEADGTGKSIRLGYDDYPVKLDMLADLLAFFKTQPEIAGFDRIDLNDVNRVIVNPLKADPPPAAPRGG
jgi:cell division protein FtsQ